MSQIATILQNHIIDKTMSPLEVKSHMLQDIFNVKRTRHFSTGCDVYNSTNYDYLMRIILLGDQGVGKSSLMKALNVHPDVKKVKCLCRVGHIMDHLEVEVVTSSGKTALIRLCDTGGQERYRSLTSSYYRGAHGALVVFDLKHHKSLNNVETWLSDLETFSSASACTRVLLGSNCTSKDRKVTSLTARQYAESRALPYIEFDSTHFYNIVESLQLIVDKITKEVAFTPTNPYFIKPSSISLDHHRNDEMYRFTCPC